MYHYTYKILCPSGKYYVGRHSTTKLNDGYMGSGKWSRSIIDKSILIKEIIAFHDSYDALREAEFILLKEHVGRQDCMNFNNRPVGFASGELNPATSEKRRNESKKRFLENNPSKREDVKAKKSKIMKGRPAKGKRAKGYKMTDEHRNNISLSRIGIKYSEEGKRKLSESRKKQYLANERILPSAKGRKHTQEAKKLVSDSALSRAKLTCPHCNTEAKPHTFKRWHGQNCKSLKEKESISCQVTTSKIIYYSERRT